MEIVFEVTQGFRRRIYRRSSRRRYFTEANSCLNELAGSNVQEAVEAYFFDGPKPASIQPGRLVRDEVLAIA